MKARKTKIYSLENQLKKTIFMKKTLLLLLIVAFAATVNAQTSDKKWGIGTGAGAYGTLENGGIGILPELYFSRYLSPRFDLMFQGNLGVFRSTVKNNDLDFKNLLLNLRLKLSNETKNLRPYLYGGPGLLDVNNFHKIINFDAGLGTKYYFGPKLAFYIEAGYLHGLVATRNGISMRENYWKSTAGLEFNLGKSKDSDMDGVSDNKDKCTNTPAGVAVDGDGCPLDSDGDWIADYIDDCPTVAGLTSLKGCPDTDKDGIADKNDACPDVAGIASLKGCPDTDGDGITDLDDKCPNTKKGWKVDASGCPLDKDNDGVADSEDDCPTVAGPKENKGCPVNKKEVKLDQIEILNIKVGAVHFVSGKTYITEYSQAILDKMIKILIENKDYNINISGYTDSQGSDADNLKLAEERIRTTTKYLESKGISSDRIIKQNAFGEAKPVATNNTPAGRLINRRAEFELFITK